MGKKVAVIGASLGGLVAAAELNRNGCHVTIIEKGNVVGGLFNKISTPFGVQELGMHVLYVNDIHYEHLVSIFGAETFNVMEGSSVDIGACYNFGTVNFNSLYPNVLGHPRENEILDQLLISNGQNNNANNALEEVVRRFGEIGGREVVAPILKKLWKTEPELLSKNAVHCFFDLRRIIACHKDQADQLKQNPWLDSTIGNPIQDQPAGQIFGGRKALTVKTEHKDFSSRVNEWVSREGLTIKFSSKFELIAQCLAIDGVPAHQEFDGCIVAMSLQSITSDVSGELDQLDLSIYYFQLSDQLVDSFPAYYILCHATELKSSRIVNYDAYNQEHVPGEPSVLAVEVLHGIDEAPDEEVIAKEVMRILPTISIVGTHRLAKSVRVCTPSLKNGEVLDSVKSSIESHFADNPVFFTGMRTDTGVFFSHHTIGLAYDSALECCRRLS